jgi:hypothetical protein
MRHKFTRRGSILTIALLAVLAAVGVGYAAIPSSDGVIHSCYNASANPSGQLRVIDADAGAKCSKNEKALNFNQTGPQGPKGDTGATGPQGPTGDIGPSHAYSAQANGVSLSGNTTVATLSLSAGSYSIGAKLYIRASHEGTFTGGASCTLTADGDTDFSQATARSTDGFDINMPMSLAVLHTFASPGSVALSCGGSGADITAEYVVITAIRVGGIG